MFAKQASFVGAKIPCPYGPSEGDEGLKKNVDVFKQARQSVGPDFPLMSAQNNKLKTYWYVCWQVGLLYVTDRSIHHQGILMFGVICFTKNCS